MKRRRKETTQICAQGLQLLKAEPLARILNCGVSTVYFLARTGKIPTISIGRAGVRFIAKDVIAALTRQGPKS